MALGGNDASGSITANSGSSTAPAAGSTLILNTLGQGAGAVQVEGTFVGTLILEGTVSGSAAGWVAITMTNMAGVAVSTITAPGIFVFDASRFSQVRARSTAWPSGTAVLTMIAGPGSGGGSGGGGGGGGGAITVADGADVALGTTTDAGIITNANGTAIGFLRGAIIQWAAFLARLPAALVGGRLDVNVGATGVTQPVSGTVTANAGTGTLAVSAASLPLPTGAAADATIGTTNTEIGGLTETAPATDTASSGLNGRLQRVAQRITSLIGLLPTALVGGRLDVNLGAAPAAVTIGTNAALVTGSATIGAVTQGTQGAGGTASWNVQGAAAANAALAGNPVLLGGSDGTNVQTLRVAGPASGSALSGAAGTSVLATVSYMLDQATQWVPLSNGRQALDAAASVNLLATGSYLWNGVTSDRLRAALDVTILSSAARTTTQSGTITTYNLGAIKFILDMTVVTASPSVTLTISETDLASGKTILLLSGAAVVTAVTNEYTVDPVVPAVANVSAQKRVPRTLFWQVTANNANSGTYSLGSMQLPA